MKRIMIGAFIVQALRQPSTYQVHHNLESQQLQYAMQERLRILAWKEIEVMMRIWVAQLGNGNEIRV